MPNQVEPEQHGHGRHANLRHLRQPARRGIPGQPDVASARTSANSRSLPAVRKPSIRRHESRGRHERRRRRRRRVHDGFEVVPYGTSFTPSRASSRIHSPESIRTAAWPLPYPVLAPEGDPNSTTSTVQPPHQSQSGLEQLLHSSSRQFQRLPTTAAATASSSSRRSYAASELAVQRAGRDGRRTGPAPAKSEYRA